MPRYHLLDALLRRPEKFPISVDEMLWSIIGGKYMHRRFTIYREFLRPYAETELYLKRKSPSLIDEEIDALITAQDSKGINEETFRSTSQLLLEWMAKKRVEKATKAALTRWSKPRKPPKRKRVKKAQKKP